MLYRKREERGLRQLKAKKIHQIVGEAVQLETEGIGQKTVTTQAVGAEAILEFLDPVLALATIIVKGKDLRSLARAVGNEEAQISAGRGVLGFVTDTALVRPTAGAVAEAGETALTALYRVKCGRSSDGGTRPNTCAHLNSL